MSAAVCYPQGQKPKNIILLIGDGMGLNAVTVSDFYIENSQFRRFPYTGLVNTRSANQLITDSGAGGSAYSTGERILNRSVGVDTTGKPLLNVLEYAKRRKLETGIVATKAITDATPASFYAHVSQRANLNDVAEFLLKNKVDIVIGGGRGNFLPENLGGERKDNKNLIDSLQKRGYQLPATIEELKNTSLNDRIVALLEKKHLPRADERKYTLGEMTSIALERLSRNKKGFFVMIEGSQIDSWLHLNEYKASVNEIRDFNSAIKAALDFAEKDKNTLVIVIADHETGGLSITGGNFKEPVVKWTTKDHTASLVGVFAYGPSASLFTGLIDNYQIGRIIFKLLGK